MSARLRLTIIMAVMLSLALPAAASAGTISGTVTGAAGKPLGNVTVIFTKWTGSTGVGAGQTKTLADGTYSMDRPAATYTIRFWSTSDYLSEHYDDTPDWDVPNAERVTVSATGTVTADATLSLGGYITGKLTGVDGKPLAGVSVDARSTDPNVSVPAASTDKSGNYKVRQLPTGSYTLKFGGGDFDVEWYDNAPSLAAAKAVAVTAGQTTAQVNATIRRLGSIAGTVRNQLGTPEPNVRVEVLDLGGDTVAAETTDADGTYAITRVLPGTYKVRFDPGVDRTESYYDGEGTFAAADPVVLGDGQALTGIDGETVATGSIGGTATLSGGGPAIGGQVRVYEGAQTVAAEFVAPDGSYTVPDLEPGEYTVQFRPDDHFVPTVGADFVPIFHGGTWFREDSTPVTVVGGEVQDIDGVIPREAVLTGNLRFPDGSATASVAHVYDALGRQVGRGFMSATGVWTARELPAGPLKVLFTSTTRLDWSFDEELVPAAPLWVEDKWFANRFSHATADPVTATAGVITGGIDSTMQRAGTILGTVTTAESGAALKGVRVFLVRSDGRRAGPFRTDYKGHYVAYGLRAGDWTLGFVPDTAGRQTEYYDDVTRRAWAKPIAVTYAHSTTADATLARAARISGLVTDEARGAIPGVVVTAYNGFDEAVSSTVTGASGSYELGRLPTGTYRIGFAPPPESGFAAEYYDDTASLAAASSVWATAGSTTPAIDAELVPAE